MQVVIDLARFPNFETDLAFTKQLLMEESVFCLPGNVRKDRVIMPTYYVIVLMGNVRKDTSTYWECKLITPTY